MKEVKATSEIGIAVHFKVMAAMPRKRGNPHHQLVAF